MHNNNCPEKLTCVTDEEESNEISDKCIECGMPFTPRIVGGTDAIPYSIPWQVGITLIESNSKVVLVNKYYNLFVKRRLFFFTNFYCF